MPDIQKVKVRFEIDGETKEIDLERHVADEKDAQRRLMLQTDAGSKSCLYLDPNGDPNGGYAFGNGFTIALRRPAEDGADIVEVLEAVRNLLLLVNKANNGKFECPENIDSLDHLQTAIARQHERTRDREDRGVEGTQTP